MYQLGCWMKLQSGTPARAGNGHLSQNILRRKARHTTVQALQLPPTTNLISSMDVQYHHNGLWVTGLRKWRCHHNSLELCYHLTCSLGVPSPNQSLAHESPQYLLNSCITEGMKCSAHWRVLFLLLLIHGFCSGLIFKCKELLRRKKTYI